MPRAEVGTPKYLANAMKSKGLQRLRWYCQICQKQCRDDNGFKCHLATESHLRQALSVGESAGKHISDFSQQFQSEFVMLLSRRHSTNRVKANNVYQEFIQDKHHLHMNSTRWLSLSEFIKHLGRTGVVRVEETEKGLFISWIDNSPKALAKAEASMKKERATTSDEQRERTLIAEQIERARALAGEAGEGSDEDDDEADGPAPVGLLQRGEGAAPLKLSFGTAKKTSPSPEAEAKASGSASGSNSPPPTAVEGPTSTSTSPPTVSNPIPPSSSVPTIQPAMKFNAFKKASASAAAVPVKTAPAKINVFKMGKPSASSSASSASSTITSTSTASAVAEGGPGVVIGLKRGREVMPAAQRLILEEEERKRRRLGTA